MRTKNSDIISVIFRSFYIYDRGLRSQKLKSTLSIFFFSKKDAPVVCYISMFLFVVVRSHNSFTLRFIKELV